MGGFMRMLGPDGIDGLEAEFKQAIEAKDKPRGGPFGWALDLLEGTWESITGTLGVLRDLTVQVVYDSGGWAEDWSALGTSLWEGLHNPGDFLYQFANIDMLRQNPAKWFGGLVPDALAFGFTAGTGAAASRGASGLRGAARGADKLDDLSDLRHLDLSDLRRRSTDARSLDEWDEILSGVDPDSVHGWQLREQYAEDFYGSVRAADPAEDLEAISRSSGMHRRRSAKIRDHVFSDEHQLRDRYGRFDADPDMADAWRRLREGKLLQSDIDLLRHELAESNCLQRHPGATYDEAHNAVLDEGFTWEPPDWRPGQRVPSVSTHDLLADGGKSIGRPGRSPGVRIVSGGTDQAEALFGRLSAGGNVVEGTSYPGKMSRLPDGTPVELRPTSKSGGPAIDIKYPSGERIKIHFEE